MVRRLLLHGKEEVIMIPLELQAARLSLLKKRPYLAAAVWRMVPVAREGMGTLAVDQHWRLYYDPQAIASWSTKQLTGVLYHEVLHLLRRHPDRLRIFEPRVANIAADMEINDDLREERVLLPYGALYPDQLDMPEGLLAEEYVHRLMSQNPRAQKGVSGEGDGGDGDALSQEEGASTRGQKTSGATEGGSPMGEADSQPAPAQGRCGSCATGRREEWEEAGDSKTDAVSPQEAEIIRRAVAREITDRAKGIGQVPGHLQRWAEETLEPPKVDWRRVLEGEVRRAMAVAAGKGHRTYLRPNPRSGAVIHRGHARHAPKVAVVLDTSGSIDSSALRTLLSELIGIVKSLAVPMVDVVVCDAQVHGVYRRVTHPSVLKLEGGGGTDMRVGIAAAMKLHPDVVIVLTDGYTSWPDDPLPVQLVVGLVFGGCGDTPSWAKTVPIEP